MANNQLNFDTFKQDAEKYLKDLSTDLGHPEEKQRVLIAWRAVMHTVRDRIHHGESFDLMAPLPMIFKGIYAQNWKYSEKPPLDYETMDEMKEQVKKLQDSYGEQDFPWEMSTDDIIFGILNSLKKYVSDEQLNHICGQLPKDIQEQMSERV